MKDLNRANYPAQERPIRILQFGAGNFMRAFVDWILQDLNRNGIMNAGAVVVQPTPNGRAKELAQQDGLYTVLLEGIENGGHVQKHEVIDVLQDFVVPYTEYEKFLSYARSEDLQIVISNTTEAGIALDETDTDFSVCPKSYPGKLLAFLHARYEYFGGAADKGLAIIPCELIDRNGSELRRILIALANINRMSEDFIAWLTSANHFTNTLVDRIVPGYPRDNAAAICEALGYNDINLVKGEIFHLWVIEKEPFICERFPADKSGLNVIFADDITPYKQRKVKILNGAHTAMVPVAYLCGIDTVREAVTDPEIGAFVRGLINSEIKPTIALPKAELNRFAADVIERFLNPSIRHELMSIALNSTTKFRTRLLPTYNDYRKKNGVSPRHILFALASMIVFFRGRRGKEEIRLQDDAAYLDFWRDLWKLNDFSAIAEKALAASALWGQDLRDGDNVCVVAGYIEHIVKEGERAALRDFLGD